MTQSKEFPEYVWMGPPRSYTPGRVAGQPTVVIVHDTEGAEGITAAEDGALYDQRRTDGTSTHFFVDPDSVVQCVLTTDEAHAARTQGNNIGIQIEMCGKASQGATGWADTNSRLMIAQTAKLAAKLCKKYGIPVRRLTLTQLRNGEKGICGHVDITNAFPQDNGTHTDPGPTFPWATFLSEVAIALNGEEKRFKVLPLTGLGLAELKYGMDDADYAGYNMIWRLQKMLKFTGADLDGIYGDKTAAAVKAYMGSGDGKTVGVAEWTKLYGLSKL